MMSSSNSGPAAAASSSRSVVRGARRERRWLTTSRTLSGVPSSRQRPGEPDRAVGDLDGAGLDQRAPQLADQERVAVGELADRPGQLGRARRGLAARGAPDELGHLRAGEPAQPQPHDVLGAAQVGERLRERLGHVGLGVAEGGEQQHARVAGGPRQMAQEEQRRRVRPVAVLEHEQERPAAADARRGGRSPRCAAGGARCRDRPRPAPAARRRAPADRAAAASARRRRAPSAARSSAGSTTRARWSSASTNGPYGVRTTASQAP